jgi:Prealbumin-like fold domain
LKITKTVLSLMLVMITILTAITTTIAAVYAGGGDGDDNGEGNKQKSEDDSAAAIADCDDNEVERAGFDCIAIAANDVEIETEPPAEERATLSVCKDVRNSLGSGFSPGDFDFTVTGNDPFPDEFEGSANCVDVDIGPGEYTVSEVLPPPRGFTLNPRIEGDCVQGPIAGTSVTGEIQSGETQECRFINTIGD